MINKKTIIKKASVSANAISWERAVPRSVFPLAKGSRAGVVLDQEGAPRIFVFDTGALLDVLSVIDEQLVDRLPTRDYYNRKVNPAGWLIDEIEAKLPLRKEYIISLKQAIIEAEKIGWVKMT